eukprot:5347218-Ditylum_brightwellii.AAC.1
MAQRIIGISVGLFAYFGPCVVQISALFLGYSYAEEVSLIKPGVNFLTMESISMLPPQCDELKETDYHGMKLVLNQHEELNE